MNKLTSFCVSLAFLLLLSIPFLIWPIRSIAISDDFTSDPRFNPNWSVQNSDGLSWDNPGITLSKLQSGSFPYLRTTSSFSSISDKYYEITFQYIFTGSSWGVGGSFTDNPPNFPTSLSSISDYLNYNVSYFFGEKLHVVTALCPITSTTCPNSWWFVYPNLSPSNTYSPSTPVDNLKHTFSILRNDIGQSTYTYQVYLDDKLLFDSKNTSRLVSSVWLGHPSNLGGLKDWPILKIYSVKSLPNKPSRFPYFSQKDPLWGTKEYDSASSWAGIDKSGINRWGCALTSVAMVLQNYDVKTTTGEAVNPDNLNNWLKSQPDGYIGPGLLNWLAVTRFVKNSFDAGAAPKKLEYVRSYLPVAPILPAILSTGSHFVVAHSEDTTNWNINDPANVDTKTLAKTTNIKSINRFVESETDLSYLMFMINSSDSAVLKDSSNNPVEISWMDESLSDDMETSTPSATRIGMVAKPATANYILTINKQETGVDEAKVYLYDQTANPTIQTVVINKPVTSLLINYSKDNSAGDVITEVDLTPPPVPTVLSPSSGVYVKPAGLILDWSDVTDPSMPVTYNYKSHWSSGTYGPVSTGTTSQIDASGTTDGEYMWQVQACDSVLNCSEWTEASKIIVDSTAPTSDILFPTPGPSSNYFEVIYSELVNPVEATDGANYYLSNWPGAGGSGDLVGDANITYNPTSKTARIIFTNHGWYISPEQLWGVRNIHDLAGNVLFLNSYTEYSTPMAPPTVNVPVTIPNPTNSLTQTWSWLPGSDIGSGIKGYSTKTYDVVAQQYLSDWLWIGEVLGTSTSLGEGQWMLSIQATDFAGNVSDTKTSETLTIDTTIPSVPSNLHFVSPDLNCGEFTNSRYITFDWDNATDNNQVAGYQYNVDYPLGDMRGSWTTFFTTSSYRGSLNEGIHYLKLRTKDKAGNYSAWSNSCAITYDSVAPRFSSKTSFSGWYNQAQTSEFSFEDINLDPSYIKPLCEIATEGLNNTCQVTPDVCDKAGNCYKNILTSNPVNIDLSKPTLSLHTWGTTINGTATDNLSGIDRVMIKNKKPDNSETMVTATGTNNWTYTMSESTLGNYKIVIAAYDNAGNVSDEIVKEFTISPSQDNTGNNSENNEAVLGVITTSSNPIRRIVAPEPVLDTVVDELKEPEDLEQPIEDGKVLSETDTVSQKSNLYYWIFGACTLGLLGLIVFIFQVKRK